MKNVQTEQTEGIFIEMWEDKIDDLRGKRKNSQIYRDFCCDFSYNNKYIDC